MNVKRFVSASLAVYVASLALGFLIHGVILKPTYDSLASIWRPNMNSLMWIVWVNGLITSVIFTYIFAKGYEGKESWRGHASERSWACLFRCRWPMAPT